MNEKFNKKIRVIEKDPNKKKISTHDQNIQELWDNIKKPNLRIFGIEDCEMQANRIDNVFRETVEKIFQSLRVTWTSRYRRHSELSIDKIKKEPLCDALQLKCLTCRKRVEF